MQSDNAGTPNAPHVVMNYTYDGNGNETSVSDTINGVAGATDSMQYNNLNQLATETESGANVQNKRVDYGYDALSRVSSIALDEPCLQHVR